MDEDEQEMAVTQSLTKSGRNRPLNSIVASYQLPTILSLESLSLFLVKKVGLEVSINHKV